MAIYTKTETGLSGLYSYAVTLDVFVMLKHWLVEHLVLAFLSVYLPYMIDTDSSAYSLEAKFFHIKRTEIWMVELLLATGPECSRERNETSL